MSGTSVLHASWGLGSSWPAQDRTRLAQLSSGKNDMPAAAECFAIAAVLASAATVVLCRPTSRVRRGARACVLAGFAVRGLTGITGSTGVLVPWSPSEEFATLDRRWYGPLCLVIAGLVAAGSTDAASGSSA
jgi:hypothetical protein